MVSISEWYERVNSVPLSPTPPTYKEAVNAVRRLFRFIMKRPWPGKFAPAKKRNGYTWPRAGVYYVNPNRRDIYNSNKGGWHDLIHDVSHYLYRKKNGWAGRPHCRQHARLELKLRKEAVKRGWVAPPPEEKQPEPTPAAAGVVPQSV